MPTDLPIERGGFTICKLLSSNLLFRKRNKSLAISKLFETRLHYSDIKKSIFCTLISKNFSLELVSWLILTKHS